MKLRGLKQLLLASLLVCASSQAFAQSGGMTFGAEEATKAAPLGPSPVAGILAEGKKLYGEEKYLEAAQKFYAVTLDNSPAAQIDKNEAQYQLAKTLFRLGLYQSSLSYYKVIIEFGETHPFFLPALNGLFELSDEIPEDAQLTELLYAYQAYYPRDVPPKYRDRFAYLVGRALDQGAGNEGPRPEDAVQLLGQVQFSSPDYPKAQYIAGVSNISLDQPKDAEKNFKNSLRWLSDKRKKTSLNNDEKRLLELGYLALARLFYSTRQFQTSIKYYGRIDRRSENWPVVLFESSWAYFQLDNYNQALGNLQSLNSPFFSDRYFPEGPILSAVLYFYNCRYDRVRGILDDFAYEYEPLQKNVQKLIDRFSSDFDSGYKWLINARTKELENKQLERVVSAALNDKLVRGKLQLLVAIDKELETLAGLADEFKQSPVGVHLKETNEADRTNTKFDIGELAVKRLSRVNDQLQDLIIEQKKILFEVDRAERGEIESDLRAELAVATEEATDYKVKPSSEELVWTFDGEYWRDELGYYVVTTTSQCKR